MTQEKFMATTFGSGDKAIYKGETYLIQSVDFEEMLFGLKDVIEGADEPAWVRCENVQYICGDSSRN